MLCAGGSPTRFFDSIARYVATILCHDLPSPPFMAILRVRRFSSASFLMQVQVKPRPFKGSGFCLSGPEIKRAILEMNPSLLTGSLDSRKDGRPGPKGTPAFFLYAARPTVAGCRTAPIPAKASTNFAVLSTEPGT